LKAKFHYAIQVADPVSDQVSNKFAWVCDQIVTFLGSKAGRRQVRAAISTCLDSSNLSATCFWSKKVASWSQIRANLSKARSETRSVALTCRRLAVKQRTKQDDCPFS